MKITFVGTSHGVPSAERACTCFMIESGASVYFIDAGAPLADSVLRYGRQTADLRAVFISHIHTDHMVGLLHMADLLNWYYKELSAKFYIPDQACIDAAKNWIVTCNGIPVDEERIRFTVPSAGLVYQDENIKVEYIPTQHHRTSHAILVTEGDKQVLFSGDLSGGLRKDDMPDLIREELDAFVCELAHFGMEHLAPYLDECRAKKVFITHVYPVAKYEDVEKVKGNYPFALLTPADGDSVLI